MFYCTVRVDEGRMGTENTHNLVCLRVPGAEWFDHVSRDRITLLLPFLRIEYLLESRQELWIDCLNELSLNLEWVFDIDGIVRLAGGRLVGGRFVGRIHIEWPKRELCSIIGLMSLIIGVVGMAVVLSVCDDQPIYCQDIYEDYRMVCEWEL